MFSWRDARRLRLSPDAILTRLEIITPPINVFRIARSIGVEIVLVNNPGWVSAVHGSATSGRAVVWLDAAESCERQRFALAHSLGHLLRYPLGVAYRDASFNGTDDEIEANRFAADLLAPFWMLDPVSSLPIDRIAKIFKVTAGFVDVRLR